MCIGQWILFADDGLNEVLSHASKGFPGRKFRYVNIARTVIDHDAVFVLIGFMGETGIIDPYFFRRLQVVVNDHFFIAADQCLTHFHRR